MLPLSQLRANVLLALANMQHVLQPPAVDKHCSSEGHRTRLATADPDWDFIYIFPPCCSPRIIVMDTAADMTTSANTIVVYAHFFKNQADYNWPVDTNR